MFEVWQYVMLYYVFIYYAFSNSHQLQLQNEQMEHLQIKAKKAILD